MLKQKKGTALIEHETGSSYKVIKRGTAVGSFSFGGESFQAVEWGLKYCMNETAFPQNSLLELFDYMSFHWTLSSSRAVTRSGLLYSKCSVNVS